VDCDVVSVIRVVNCCSCAAVPFTISELVWGIAVLGATSWSGRLLCEGASSRILVLLTTIVVVLLARAILQLFVDEPAHKVHRSSAVSLSRVCVCVRVGFRSLPVVHSATSHHVVARACASIFNLGAR